MTSEIITNYDFTSFIISGIRHPARMRDVTVARPAPPSPPPPPPPSRTAVETRARGVTKRCVFEKHSIWLQAHTILFAADLVRPPPLSYLSPTAHPTVARPHFQLR